MKVCFRDGMGVARNKVRSNLEPLEKGRDFMKVLFATDDSAEAHSAKELLSSLPLPPGSELLVASVVPVWDRAGGSDGGGSSRQSWTPQKVQATAERAAYYLAKPGVSTECLVTNGHPADVICRMAEERAVDMVVMGSRGQSSMTRFLLGSVSYRVARHAPSPVLIVKPLDRPIQKVLIGIDGSSDSRQAVEFLKRLPLPAETTVAAVHVVHIPVPTFGIARGHEAGGLAADVEKLRSVAKVDGTKVLQETADLLSSYYSVDTLVAEGPPAQKLVDLAESMSVDLLVVGRRGLTGEERFLLGSVSLQVCQHAPNSVLVVR